VRNAAVRTADHLQTRRRVSGKCPLERRARGDANGSRRHPESRHRGETSPSARLTSADVLEQPLVTEAIVINPPFGHYDASLVNQGHVVMIFSLVNPTEHLHKHHPPSSLGNSCGESAVHADALMAGLGGPTSHGPS
jgi:hypothetical protein